MEQVAKESKDNRVPFDMGTLAATIHADTKLENGVITSTIGAGGNAAAYAVIAHENPRYGHTGGVSPSGKPYKHWAKRGAMKYLENPLKEALPLLDQTVGKEIDKEIAKVKARRIPV